MEAILARLTLGCSMLIVAVAARPLGVLLLPLLLTLPAALARAQDYTYTTDNGTITITGSTGCGGAVTIPDIINGLPVTSIGLGAFGSLTTLTSVTIPDSVASLGDAVRRGCGRCGGDL